MSSGEGGFSYAVVMKKLLDVRELMADIRNDLEGHFNEDVERLFPELAKIAKLERKMFKNLDEWSK